MLTEEWFAVVGHDVPLTQGDLIVDCPLLKWRAPDSQTEPLEDRSEDVDRLFGLAGIRADVIVMTQACDLEQGKVSDVVLCPCVLLSRYRPLWEAAERARKQNPTVKSWKRFCEDITDGYIWNLFMMDSVPAGEIPTEHRVVDFRSVHTVPRAFLEGLVAGRGIEEAQVAPPLSRASLTILREILHAGRFARERQAGLVDVAGGEMIDGAPDPGRRPAVRRRAAVLRPAAAGVGLPAGAEPRYGRLLDESRGALCRPRDERRTGGMGAPRDDRIGTPGSPESAATTRGPCPARSTASAGGSPLAPRTSARRSIGSDAGPGASACRRRSAAAPSRPTASPPARRLRRLTDQGVPDGYTLR